MRLDRPAPRSREWLLALAFALAVATSAHAQAQASTDVSAQGQVEAVHPPLAEDCIAQAARYHGVNPWLLRAIGWKESKVRPNAIGRNKDGSVDFGAFQTNSVHLPELARYGITSQHLMNGCVSAYVSAWQPRKKINKHCLTWKALVAYHSEKPEFRDPYAEAIQQILVEWGVLRSESLPAAAPVAALSPKRSGTPSTADVTARPDQGTYDATATP